MTQQLPRFGFERLEVFCVAREAVAMTLRLRLKGLPGDVADQLERALFSTVANIAEGAGRESRADQNRHYAIARGSANEAGAALMVAHLAGKLADDSHEAIRSRLIRVVQMLNRLIHRSPPK